MADFIAKCTIPDMAPVAQQELTEEDALPLFWPWILHVDGSSTPSTSDAEIILTSPKGEAIEYTLHFAFFVSNNEAEYEALL